MQLSPQLKSLLLLASENPTSKEYRLVAADMALDEGLDYLSECLHWMVKEGKYPINEAEHPELWGSRSTGKTNWQWRRECPKAPTHCRLLPVQSFIYFGTCIAFRPFDSAFEAEMALCTFGDKGMKHGRAGVVGE